ncbi:MULTISPECIES: helix-turn-helix domain-containing protein [Micromonospora]|uniref:AlbA family DNA-binding domain-containing protein n=1 Tax=Micromonospora TaxID=1873 RepID=UPI00340935E2
MAAVVEPVLTEEKLRSLLAEGCEQSCLDFKTMCDLSHTYDTVALVKDVAAMLGNDQGGYIIIGVADDGTPVTGLTRRHLELFDESRLRAKIGKYITEPLELGVARHTIDGCPMVLLYVAASPRGFHIFTRNGEYEIDDPQAKGGKRKGFEFRRGEVYVRRGTSSVVWEPADRERLIAAIVGRQKEQWRAEYREEMSALISVRLAAHNLQQLPASAMTWRLDASAFDELALELMRRHDDIPLRRALLQAITDAAEISPSDLAEIGTLLHRVTSIAALALTYGQDPWFTEAVTALVRIYESPSLTADQLSALHRRLLIAAHAYSLGGQAVRAKNWTAVRTLADRKPQGPEFDYYRNWLRHAILYASRANLLDQPNVDIIGRAHNIIRESPALHTDAPSESDRVLDSLCQFDALTGIVFLADPDGSGSPSYHPNFARYRHHRTEQIFVDLVGDPVMRQQLVGGNDKRLADAMVAIDAMARRAGFRYDGWEGFAYTNNPAVMAYLAQHATNTT